jgi:DNA invertase Pin-like site-specific DNA recombinase
VLRGAGLGIESVAAPSHGRLIGSADRWGTSSRSTILRDRGVLLRSVERGVRYVDGRRAAVESRPGAVAEFEREVIKERTVAGMKAAKKRGTHVGRHPGAAAGPS